VAEEVKMQLARDYPPGALGWIDDLTWSPQPVRVPASQIDMSADDPNWAPARKNRRKVAEFVTRMRSGTAKPIVCIRRPGNRLLRAADGHTRVLASIALGRPVLAWVGTARTAHGPWDGLHQRQS
jgi:hypothetical protein